MRFGVELVGELARRSELARWLETSVRPLFVERVVELTEDLLLTWRLLGFDLQRKRRSVSPPDLLILATARHGRFTLASRNVKHLAGCGVPVYNPWTYERFNA